MSTVVFRKQKSAAPDGFFEAEAAGLRWLAEAPGGAQTVDVLDVGPGFIELAELTAARPAKAAARAFGAALAATHNAGAPAWGSPPAGYQGATFIGRQPMDCLPRDSFAQFYPEQRVLPYLRRAVDARHVDAATVQLVERACARIAAGDFDSTEPPSRIHGDLWSGNVFWTPTGVCLIDPAAHGGHRETDLAMLELFGAPLLTDILAGYSDAHPLPAGWQQRTPLHQLHPLAVHAASHGPSYAGPLAAAARATIALAR